MVLGVNTKVVVVTSENDNRTEKVTRSDGTVHIDQPSASPNAHRDARWRVDGADGRRRSGIWHEIKISPQHVNAFKKF